MNENVSENTTLLIQDLRECRNNIVTRGGTISTTAGFSGVADAILELPTISTIGAIVDDSVSYRKQVPAKSVNFCYLNSIGSMSYVSETLTATPEGGGLYYLTYTRPPDYVPGEDGSGAFDIYSPVCPFGFLVPENVSDDGVTISGYFSLRKTVESETVDADPVIPYIPAFARDVNINKRMFPENYFSGLRHAKPTAVRSYKADGTLLAEYELPTAITDKLGLGYDANLFNEYSFVEGEAIERLNSTVLSGTAGWFGIVAGRDRVGYALPSDALTIATGQTAIKANLITPFFGNDYPMSQLNNPLGYVWQVGGMILSAGQYAWFFLPQGTFDTKEEADNWFDEKQMPIVYEKTEYTRTPITTDFDPLIQVEAGGYIEFVNEYGYAVPSTVTFQTIFNA